MPKIVPRGKSLVVKRSVWVGAHNTSVSMEAAFWDAAQGIPVSQLIATIDSGRRKDHHANLTPATRLFVLDYYRSKMQP